MDRIDGESAAATATIEEGVSTPHLRAGQRNLRNTWKMFVTLLHRCIIRYWRTGSQHFVDYALTYAAASIVGRVHGFANTPESVAGNFNLSLITLGLLTTVSGLATFGEDRAVFLREARVGMPVMLYFLANNVVDLIDIVARPLLFSTMYYSFTLPTIRFAHFFAICLLISWTCTGMGYAVSVIVERKNSVMAATLAAMILGGFFSGFNPTLRESRGSASFFICHFSYMRYAIESVLVYEYRRWPDTFENDIADLMRHQGFCGFRTLTEKVPLNFLSRVCHPSKLLVRLFGLGFGLRAVAGIGLWVSTLPHVHLTYRFAKWAVFEMGLPKSLSPYKLRE